jgi:predicted  nucleic acid-binding Zn ribbon protein
MAMYQAMKQMQNMYIYALHKNTDISAVLLKLSQNTQNSNFNQVAFAEVNTFQSNTHTHTHTCSPVNKVKEALFKYY